MGWVNSILNIAFYKFVQLSGLPELRDEVKKTALEFELKGSILLSEEGINSFLAGKPESIRAFISYLSAKPEFSELEIKESWTDHVPFKRMIVKIKKEIIAMGQPDIHPALSTGERISAKELKKWLDEKREVVLLDTRNDYEIKEGTFDHAVDFNIETFKQFPDKLKEHADELKDKPVVMFCTGGIRCEKATALALQYGMKNVYQLEGGILKYFEEVGQSHYKGECFVFDGRVSVDSNLSGAVDRKTKRRVSGLTLYSYRRCPFAIRVRMTLEEKNLPYFVKEEDLSNLSPELLSFHPQGVVPLLTHQGRIIYESSIITEYLEEEFPEVSLMPKNAEDRARVRLWTHWCNEIFKPDLDLFKYEFDKISAEERDQLVERMQKNLMKLQRPLKKHAFLIGKTLTLADIHVFPFYRQFRKATHTLPGIEQFKLLDQWLESITSRPSFERVMRKHDATSATPSSLTVGSEEKASADLSQSVS